MCPTNVFQAHKKYKDHAGNEEVSESIEQYNKPADIKEAGNAKYEFKDHMVYYNKICLSPSLEKKNESSEWQVGSGIERMHYPSDMHSKTHSMTKDNRLVQIW